MDHPQGPETEDPPQENAARVGMTADSFIPRKVRVDAGEKVVWFNNSDVPHTVTSEGDRFDSGIFVAGEKYSRTFRRSGRFYYYCELHGGPREGMWGVVVVRGNRQTNPPEPIPPPDPEPYPPDDGNIHIAAADDLFEPAATEAVLGQTVVWTNRGNHVHDVRSEAGAFASGRLDPGDTFSFTVDTEGTFYYFCSYHGDARQGMWGVVAAVGEEPDIRITDEGFDPSELQIEVGETVTWINLASGIQSISSDEGLFESGDLLPGDRFTYTFEQPGRFEFFSRHSPGTRGVVTVTEVAATVSAGTLLDILSISH